MTTRKTDTIEITHKDKTGKTYFISMVVTGSKIPGNRICPDEIEFEISDRTVFIGDTQIRWQDLPSDVAEEAENRCVGILFDRL